MKFTKTPLTASQEARIKDLDESYVDGSLVRLEETGQLYPAGFDFEGLKSFKVFDDDVFVVTPPKCGTTWLQEIVWLILNDVDLKAAKVNQFYRFPYLETSMMRKARILPTSRKEMPATEGRPYPEGVPLTDENLYWYLSHSVEYARRMPRPRTIKSHTRLKLLPDELIDTCKVIFMARNVKDMVVSQFHHIAMRKPAIMERGFNMFAKNFKDCLMDEAPGISMMLEGWKFRHHPNFLFLTYEELQRDFYATVKRITAFLNVKLCDEKLALLKHATSFRAFRQNKAVNKVLEIPHDPESGKPAFIRRGKVGDWKNFFDDDLNAEWDAWIREQLRGTDYYMTFEL